MKALNPKGVGSVLELEDTDLPRRAAAQSLPKSCERCQEAGGTGERRKGRAALYLGCASVACAHNTTPTDSTLNVLGIVTLLQRYFPEHKIIIPVSGCPVNNPVCVYSM